MRDKGFWNTQTHVKLTTTKKVYKNSLINKSEKIAQLYITLVNTNQQANEKKQPNKEKHNAETQQKTIYFCNMCLTFFLKPVCSHGAMTFTR